MVWPEKVLPFVIVCTLLQHALTADAKAAEGSHLKLNLGKSFPFTTCGNIGPQGPTQWQCNSAYAEGDSEVRVAVNDDAGVQIWEVPETSTFSITALGASGGKGADNQKQSNGAYAHAKFNLTKGDSIYMVIGQLGSDACSGSTKGLNKYQQQQQELVCRQGPLDTLSKGGGGGGGGGTFVYKKHVDTGRVVTLIVAGGGGGKSFRGGAGLIKADGGLQEGGAGVSATTPVSGPGGGGGWNGSALFNQSGRALLEGALGGDACWEARQELGWHTQGGFGGGGGGCTAGGGGGGYTGGNVSVTDKDDHNGMGGSSYISPEGWDHHLDKGTQRGSGEVEIAYVLDCPCEFMCIYKNYEKKDFKCYCPPNQLLAEDTYHCIDPSDMLTGQDHPSITWITIGSCVAAGICLLLIVFCILVYMRSRKKVPAVRLEQLSSPDYQLGRLRSAITATNHSMEYNPNYDFGGTKYTLQDLREVPRDTLTLVKALGQGAFGEVYEGLLIHMPGDAKDLGVAVKTLPALCTDQAEMDFLMEALIMSKFNHPNIVRFIGVCFEKHPRFIVLELLEGGDLKSFLRAARPKPEQPTRMSMMDLVKLSMDVAKGCQYLEENHFIHRDIAARNCLLTTRGPGRIAKIADFGMARDIYRADYYRKGGKAMLPVKWMPPEAFLDGVFTSKTDVWSFGILLWEVFSLGYMPYPGRGNQEVVQLVTTGGRLDPPQNCPKSVYHIMTMCWHGVPERRPTFGTAILKLKQCLQDAEVMHTSLPVFHRVPSVERDTTLVRPRDADRGVLTVDPPPKVMEPDSPDSTDHLLGPASPNFDLALLQKQANMSPSAESLDELLRAGGEGCGGGAACGAAGRGGPGDRGAHGGARGGPYAGVFKYDDMSPHDDLCYHEDMTSSGGAGSASTSLLGSEMADSGKSSIGNVSQEETRAASGGSGSALSAPDSLWGEGGTWALGPGATVTLPHPLPELPHHAPTPPSSLIDGEQRDTGDGTLSDHSLDIDNHQQGPESKAVYENILSPIANSAHMVPYPLHQGSGSSPHRPAAPSPAPPQPHNPASPSDPATSRGVLPTVMPNHAMMTSSLGEQDGHVREVLGDSGVEVDLH